MIIHIIVSLRTRIYIQHDVTKIKRDSIIYIDCNLNIYIL